MENTATAGFKGGVDDSMMPFDEEHQPARILVRDGLGPEVSPWDNKQKILLKNADVTIMQKKKQSPNKKQGYINAQGEHIRYGLPNANEDRDYSSALDQIYKLNEEIKASEGEED